jgi:uncharacterized membrane protein
MRHDHESSNGDLHDHGENDHHDHDNNNDDGVLIPHAHTVSTDHDAKQRKKSKDMNGATTATTAVPGGRRRRVRKQSSIEKADAADVQAKCIKYSALFLLVAQMVGLVLLMRYSRTHHPPDVPLYLSSTAVFVMEVMKLIICILVVAYQTRSSFLYELKFHTIHSPMEILKLCVPSLLYTIQNNLLYLALTNLDAATYQVCYQLKILTTALFSAILLHRKFSTTKWASLVVLTVGVAIVQLSGSKDQHQEDSDNTSSSDRYRTIGLIAVFCAAATSGFSGVYFGT